MSQFRNKKCIKEGMKLKHVHPTPPQQFLVFVFSTDKWWVNVFYIDPKLKSEIHVDKKLMFFLYILQWCINPLSI